MNHIKNMLRKGCLYVAGLSSFYPKDKTIRELQEEPGYKNPRAVYNMDYHLRPLHVTKRKKGPGQHRRTLVECRMRRTYTGLTVEDEYVFGKLWKANYGWRTVPLRSGVANDVYVWVCHKNGWAEYVSDSDYRKQAGNIGN